MAYRKRRTTARRTTRAAPRRRTSTRRAASPRQQTVRIVLQQVPAAAPFDMTQGLASLRSPTPPRKPIAG